MTVVRVVNSSPLIVFQRIGQLNLVPDLLEHVYIPLAVQREVFGSDLVPDWIEG